MVYAPVCRHHRHPTCNQSGTHPIITLSLLFFAYTLSFPDQKHPYSPLLQYGLAYSHSQRYVRRDSELWFSLTLAYSRQLRGHFVCFFTLGFLNPSPRGAW